MVVVMEPSHALAGRRYIRPQDFAGERLFLGASSAEDSTLIQKVLIPAGVVPRQASYVQLTEAIVEMVKGGLGISFLARWAIQPHIRAGTLVGLPLSRRGYMRHWHAAMIRSKSAPPYILEFAKLLAEHPISADGL